MPQTPIARDAHPRPRLTREHWWSLNGRWQFAIDPDARLGRDDVDFAREIEVPFAPETQASGVGETGFFSACWYRRAFTTPELDSGERLLMHFGAVDHEAIVWINGTEVVRHRGGYTPFVADVTDQLRPTGDNEVVVRAFDDPHDLEQPRGKQDWEREPHAIWYPRTTGIWQTVWLEVVPETRIARLDARAHVDRWAIEITAQLEGEVEPGLVLSVTVSVGGRRLAEDATAVVARRVTRMLALEDPGVERARRDILWSPSSPTLLELGVELRRDGVVLDRVASYTAMRSVAVESGHFLLNGRPYRLRLALDQGYWPESGMTPPSNDALRGDVELTKALGFNGVRKHQKIEDPRFLYWADRLGLVVWEEMPSAYRFSDRSIAAVLQTWQEVIERDSSNPCVVAWVPLNESWGVPDLPSRADQRSWLAALAHLTKALDPTRPVVANDGWETAGGDLVGVHDYDSDAGRLLARYAGLSAPEVLETLWPGGRRLTLEHVDTQAIVLSEFGGIVLSSDPGAYGYERARGPEDLLDRYEALLAAVHTLPFAGFCYTQLYDTYQEANGLLTFDRRPKAPLARLHDATFGHVRPFAKWEEQPPAPPTAVDPSVATRAVSTTTPETPSLP
jgi:beta-galactosidase/beta-glucuronidase